ncbi:MAG: IS66 family transposase [Leptolyngbyaceae cyanobacterium CSU_1_4]|nr:IS66 family transposase [Leptolyngbyaceae cyanobacterium CSU_1_4]
MGEEISEQLDYIPAKIQVLQNVRYKYGCRGCEDTVQTADLKGQPLPKCNASPSLLAHILISKYQDHLPLYRQAQIWERLGIDLGRATMSRWVIEVGDRLSLGGADAIPDCEVRLCSCR